MWRVASGQRPSNPCPFITALRARRCNVSLSREHPNIFSYVVVHIKIRDEFYAGCHKPTATLFLYPGLGPAVQAQAELSTKQPLYLNYASCYYLIMYVSYLVLDYNVLCIKSMFNILFSSDVTVWSEDYVMKF